MHPRLHFAARSHTLPQYMAVQQLRAHVPNLHHRPIAICYHCRPPPPLAATMGSQADDQLHANADARARRTNGATQTFRRPSHATTPSGSALPPASRDAPAPGPSTAPLTSSGVYVPPHAQPGRTGGSVEGRYSRDQLVQLFQSQRETNEIKEGLSHLYMGSWEPHATNGASGASWGRKDDLGRDGQSGVDQCWDKDGSIQPMHTIELTEEEREVRTTQPNPFIAHPPFTCLPWI